MKQSKKQIYECFEYVQDRIQDIVHMNNTSSSYI
jgi:hypothetical protein